MKNLEIKVKDIFDVSGGKDAYAVWKEQHDQADVIFYLLRADRLIARDKYVEARVRDDLRHIGQWLKDRRKRPRFFIIGTHCDFDPDFTHLSEDKLGDYVDKFTGMPIISELVARSGSTKQVKIVLGSMKDVHSTEDLVWRIFRQLVS